MSHSTEETLTIAAKSGETLQIIYHGGSQPGTVREIKPLRVTPREVRAFDLSTGIAKLFLVDRIELACSGAGVAHYTAPAPEVVIEGHTVHGALASRLDELESQGWHVELTVDAMSVHRFFKNGNPRKKPDAELRYREYVQIQKYNPFTGATIESQRKSSKPYRVTSRNLGCARAFSNLSKAATLFLKEAQSLAPHRGN